MLSNLARRTIHVLNGNRKMYYQELEKIAVQSGGRRVLEIGSGKQVDGAYPYSASHLFTGAAEFVMTDINSEFGHRVLDVTTMDDHERYDVIVCLNVLEHVYDFHTAVTNLRAALAEGGVLVVAVPFTFPLHDEPVDYWRFTEHALRKMLGDFTSVTVKHQRARRWPTGYFVVATK